MALLIAIIVVTEVVMVIIIMEFVIIVFIMIIFFFQSYTITVITLETSPSFYGQTILTVLGDISPSNYLILNVLFSRIQPQLLGWKFEGFAIVHCSICCRCNLFVWLFLWRHGSTVAMSYCPFSLHKKSQHLWYLAYISSWIFQKGIIYRI